MENLSSPARLRIIRLLAPAVLLSLVAWGIAVSFCSITTDASPSQLHSETGLSQAAANAFQTKVMELSATGPAANPVVITDREVNSFFKYDHPNFMPPSVTDVDIHFQSEGIHGAANVNFDELKPTQQFGDQLAAKLLASIFQGTQRVTALGALESDNGTGKLTIKNVHIGSTSLSDWLVNWLVGTYIQSEYKIDLSKPFLLPGHVTHIEFSPGKMIFVRGTKQKK